MYNISSAHPSASGYLLSSVSRHKKQSYKSCTQPVLLQNRLILSTIQKISGKQERFLTLFVPFFLHQAGESERLMHNTRVETGKIILVSRKETLVIFSRGQSRWGGVIQKAFKVQKMLREDHNAQWVLYLLSSSMSLLKAQKNQTSDFSENLHSNQDAFVIATSLDMFQTI